jgi:hypothetical protein
MLGHCIGFLRRIKQDTRYTVLEGDPPYHSISAIFKFVPGAATGTADATCTAIYIPVGDMGPPENIKEIAFKAN